MFALREIFLEYEAVEANLAEQILHKKHGLDMQWLQNYSSVTALPLSMVLLSEDSGARTIVSSRQDLED